jgi:drug/metabolite transporter (DMT)-like permease
VVGATFLAYLLNIYGIQHIGASATGTCIYTQPVFAALLPLCFLVNIKLAKDRCCFPDILRSSSGK